MVESDILYETPGGRFWVSRHRPRRRGFAVFRAGLTHSALVASIGNGPAPGLGIERAKSEADRRELEEVAVLCFQRL